jgi:hypothetical protein
MVVIYYSCLSFDISEKKDPQNFEDAIRNSISDGCKGLGLTKKKLLDWDLGTQEYFVSCVGSLDVRDIVLSEYYGFEIVCGANTRTKHNQKDV